MTSPIKCSQCNKVFKHGEPYRDHWIKKHLVGLTESQKWEKFVLEPFLKQEENEIRRIKSKNN